MKKLLSLFAALSVIAGVFLPVAAHAESVQTIIGLTYKSGTNIGKSLGNLVVTHPNFVLCTGSAGSSTACSFQVSGRVENVAALPLQMEVINGSGVVLSTFTISANNALITIYAGPSTNQPVYFNVSSSNYLVSGSRDYVQATNLQITGAQPNFSLNGDLGAAVDSSDNHTYSVNSKVIFALSKIPSNMRSGEVCAVIPILAGVVDYTNGSPGGANIRRDVDLEVSVIDLAGVQSEIKTLSEAKGTWNTSANSTRLEFKVCGLDPSSGVLNEVDVLVKSTLRLQGTTYTGTSTTTVVIEGTAPLKQIACSKGTKAIIVSSAFPKCPSGYSKANIPILGGKLKLSTISCVKGLTVRKVTAVIPSCPAGYRRK